MQVHTHFPYATAFAQASKEIECFGTTQCDYFYGTIPCIRHLNMEEIKSDYEVNTGKTIIENMVLMPITVKKEKCDGSCRVYKRGKNWFRYRTWVY